MELWSSRINNRFSEMYFCGGTFKCCITRHKYHIAGGYKYIKQCTSFRSEQCCERRSPFAKADKASRGKTVTPNTVR